NGTNPLYFSTTNHVWAIVDNGATASLKWQRATAAPSIPLFTGSALLYGSSDGSLHQLTNLNSAAPTHTSLALGGGTAVVGSPSYDFSNDMAYVGTDAGAIYAVTLPLP